MVNKNQVSHYDTGDQRRGYEKIRNKTLSNLAIITENIQTWVTPKDKQESRIVRKNILREIQKMLGCNRRTAFDYVLTLEIIGGYSFGFNQTAHVGKLLNMGKKEVKSNGY